MNAKNKILSSIKSVWALMVVVLAASSCQEYPDAFELVDGTPTVRYVRVPDVEVSDSLLTSAFLGNSIAIVGQNMKSVSEIWFNDQQGVLNTSLITDEVMIVSVPKTIPTTVTDKIYFINKSKRDTLAYNFNILVPAPFVEKMLCEYVEEGGVATIRGNYFLPVAGSEDPVVIFTPNIEATEVVAHSATEIQVVVPVGATEGPVSVRSRYGTTRSTFYFRDTRGMILDWDNLDASGGWRAGNVIDPDANSIAGKYVRFQGNLAGDLSDWNEDAFSFNLWGSANGRPQGNLFPTEPETSVLKFEVNVMEEWSSTALQMIFTPWSLSGTNGYIADGITPRGLWKPWAATGSYKTEGWETITIPLKDFKYDHTGATFSQMPAADAFGGLTFFVYHGGTLGKECSPVILIDNIRVVPE